MPVAVLQQYLDIVEATNTLPRMIHSDRRTETPLMAHAHWQLYQALQPHTAVEFETIYWYGSSTLNQCIEVWW